jgi:hypothetical protein
LILVDASDYQYEPAEEEVKEDDRVEGQFSLTGRDHLANEGY